MAMQRYKISRLVLKNMSQVSAMIEWNIFQHVIIQTTMKYPTISFQHIFVDFLETSGTKVWFIYVTIAKVILLQVKIDIIHPCHTAAILSRDTKRALFYHAKPRNENHGDEA